MKHARAFAAAFSTAFLYGCAPSGPQAVLRVQATYRERIALPPDAVLEATLAALEAAPQP